ncbi:apolipoprotein N-acyltransferase [Gracilimonas sediminicola]|uniref:Apolipoprotein N-acyltransferase n=1 Tax=Gracilimonas sediminicola TaxID=2952158 RepID=A0A9X2RI50_9BACT|nr:apolipoprotein N-acyltransferase [Gracilimonas sediminicola]MCP9292514.1 apolipoprotein N-acyltransferase [Gracilimonas sediminicola]
MNVKQWLENKWVLSVIAGILLGVSFPPINLSFLSFPAFILLFYLSDKCDSYKQLAYYSYAGFVVWNLIGTYWLMMASLGAGIAAILANSVLMTIPLCLAKFFTQKSESPILIAFLQAAAWVSYEFLHHQWDLSWTWLSIGNAWSNFIGVIQYISLTGHLGITFWVVLSSALAYQVFKRKQKKLAYVAIGIFLIFPVWSFLLFESEAKSVDSDQTHVAIIQPNHDSYQSYGGMSGLREVVDSLFTLTERTITPHTELIIWPENAIDGFIFSDSRTALRIADSARAWNKNFIVGTGLYKTYPEDTEVLHRGTLRTGEPYNVFNAALFVDAKGVISDYEKGNLVPIVERIPFVETLSALDVFGWVNWGEIAGFGKGTRPDMIETESFSSPGLVCYDSVYPSWIRLFVQKNASFLTIITNDGWWGDTSGHHQHFAYARLRAIEFDRWIARSANNGISGIIAPNGAIIQKTDYWVRTGFTGTVENLTTQTFFTRFGNWLSVLCLMATFFGWGYFTFTSRKKE